MEFSFHLRSNSVSTTTLTNQQTVWNYQQRLVCVVYAVCFIVLHPVCSPSLLHKTAEFYRIKSTVLKSVEYYRKSFPRINCKGSFLISNFSYNLLDTHVCLCGQIAAVGQTLFLFHLHSFEARLPAEGA